MGYKFQTCSESVRHHTKNQCRLLLLLGMAMGRGGDGFYIPRLHTRFSYIYPLPYPYSTGMRN